MSINVFKNVLDVSSIINLDNPSTIGYFQESIVKNWELKALSDYQGETYLYKDVAEKIDLGTIVKLNDSDIEYEIKEINYKGQINNEYINFGHLVNAELKDHVYELISDCDKEDSLTVHKGKIIIETISPIKFVFN